MSAFFAKTEDDDILVDFLQKVMEDNSSRKQLRTILRQPSFHRRSLLNTAIQQMQLKGEPNDMIRALARLKDGPTATRALALLER